MATDIFNYDGTLLTQLDDGKTNNNVTTLNLVGKGWKGWGQPTQQNLVWVLQNFAGINPPTYPLKGQLWYDDTTDVKIVKVWSGTEWKSSNGTVYQDTKPEVGVSPGALWYDTRNKQLFTWSGTKWDLVGPLGSAANLDPLNPSVPSHSIIDMVRIKDADLADTYHQIWRIIVGGSIVAVISKDPVFEPESTSLKNSGFNLVYPGLNFSTTLPGNGFAGNKIIQDLLPDVDNVRSLGSATNKYSRLYAHNVNSRISLPASTPSAAAAVWASTGSGQLSNPPQLGAIEFDGTQFSFVNKVGGVAVRQIPIFQQDLSAGRRLYVSSINGDDSQNGSEPSKAKKTIVAAVAISEPGDTIFVESGDYYENNPITVPARVSVVGDNLRRVIIHPIHDQLDIFHVDVGSYFFGMTFKDHRAPAYCVAFECSTATATIERDPASPNFRKVTQIKPTYSQTGYTVAPRVTVEPPPFGGVQAKAVANLVNGAIVQVIIQNPGSGYSTAPNSVVAGISGATGSGALLKVRVNLDGTIAAIDIVRPGSNYTGTLNVTIVDAVGNGQGASATAVSADGVIGSYTMTDMGSGYSYNRVPHVSIQPVTPRVITMSPYVQNCSSITGPFDINGRQITIIPGTWITPTEPGGPFATLDQEGAGSGLRIDGDVLADNTVIRSFVADSFTQINQGGIGHLIINNGYAQFVSCFTTFSSVGYWARSGGFANISNSVVDFGNYGLIAEGYYPGIDGNGYEQGTLAQTYTSTVGSVTLSSGGSGYTPNSSFAVTFPHVSASVVATGIAYTDTTGAVVRVGNITPGTGYTAIPTINWSAGTGPGPIVAPTGVVNMAENPTVRITSLNQPLTDAKEPKNATGMLLNGKFYTVISANRYGSNQWIVDLYPPLLAATAGTIATFHYLSNLSSGGLALEYVGSGVTYYALPYYGGVPDINKQVLDGEDPNSLLYPGRVYFVTIDNTGNFKVGKLFSVNFADGSVSINANSFNLTGLAGIGPFKRNTTIVGTYSDEISDDPALTHLANPTYDHTTITTQFAVRQYLQQISTDVLPDLNYMRSLGSSSSRWNNIWSNVIINNGNVTTGNISVSGSVTCSSLFATSSANTKNLVNTGNITTGNVNASGDVSASTVTCSGAVSAGSISSTGAITENGHQTLNDSNFINYTVNKSGLGATGTWDINISGTAAGSGGPAPSVQNAVTFNNTGAGATSGTTFNGSSAVTVSYNTIGAAATNQTMYIGTTAVTINRTSASQTLTGVNIDGSAGSVVNAITFNNSGAGSASGTTFNGSSTNAISYNTIGAAATNQTMYIGTTAVAINRTSASLSLTGVSIDGTSGSTGSLVTANSYQMNSLGVGTPAGGAGEIRATGDVTAFYSSDQRLKTNVKNIADPLAKVQALNGVEFDWIDSYLQQHGGEDDYFVRKHDVGVIAQEVEKVLPEVVATRTDGIKAVKYDRIVALLIEAVKELKAEIEELKKK